MQGPNSPNNRTFDGIESSIESGREPSSDVSPERPSPPPHLHVSRPPWFETAVINKQTSLVGQIEVDVCIVGAGIAGLTAAVELGRAGKSVAVIELGRIGGGETGHTSAHLTEVLDLSYQDLIANFGETAARLVCEASRSALNRIETNSILQKIDCDFQRVPGYKYVDQQEQVSWLEQEARLASQLGVQSRLLTEAPLPFRTFKAIEFEKQARFHPIKYLKGLAAMIKAAGNFIFEDTRMLDLVEGEPCQVKTESGVVLAKKVFVAAGVPSSNRFVLHTKIAAYRTYAIAVEVAELTTPPNAIHNGSKNADKAASVEALDGLFWDASDPYHYIRSWTYHGKNVLIIGGEDHKTGQQDHTAKAIEKLEDWAREKFDVVSVLAHWSGQVIEPVDGLPFIGLNPLSSHVFVATGFSGNGLTFGTLAGYMVTDLILGLGHPLEKILSPSRLKPMASARNFITENIDFPSHILTDRFARVQDAKAVLIRENEGAIVRAGAKKYAAYRDTRGELHMLSPVCPHMGCFVGWNEAEKSWDCPCHGSRFNALGKLLNGPAVSDLAVEEYDENLPLIPEYYDPAAHGYENLSAPLLSLFTCPCANKPT